MFESIEEDYANESAMFTIPPEEGYTDVARGICFSSRTMLAKAIEAIDAYGKFHIISSTMICLWAHMSCKHIIVIF